MRRIALASLVASAALLAIAGCRSKPAARPAPPVAAPQATPPAPAGPRPGDPSPWPYAMRVYTWTPDGIAQVGELPWQPPPQGLATPWYIEPVGVLDQPKLATVVAEMRKAHIPGLSLRGQPIAPWLGELRDLPDLKYLILDSTAVTGASLAAMDVSLERLYLARTAVDDAAVTAAVARHPKLRVLDLDDTAAGDGAAKAIAALGELRALNLSNTRLTDAGGAELRAVASLEIVDLGRTKIGAKTVAALAGLPILREVFLDGTRAGKEIATLAAHAANLRRFDVSNLAAYKPMDADVGWLATAPGLVEIGLSGSRVTDKVVLELVKLQKLTRLRLASTPITLAAIAAIAARDWKADFTPLEELDLAATPVDDANAALLIAGPRMRILRLDLTKITDAALTASSGPAPGLSELYISFTKVTDAGLALLDRLPRLSGLGLAEAKIGPETLARITKLTGLHTLVLTGVDVPEDALVGLGRLQEMESLYLERTRTGDDTLAALAPLKYLRVLHVGNTNISEVSLRVLRGFTQLEELTAGDTQMRAGITELDAWPRLHTLSLIGLELGDAVLPAIARRASLSMLDLSGTDIADPAPLVVLPNLRTVGLAQTKLSKAGLASIKALAARGIEVVQ
jgi:Leucine-rich repeat (LRR) protein